MSSDDHKMWMSSKRGQFDDNSQNLLVNLEGTNFKFNHIGFKNNQKLETNPKTISVYYRQPRRLEEIKHTFHASEFTFVQSIELEPKHGLQIF